MNKYNGIIATVVLLMFVLAPSARAEAPTAEIAVEGISPRDIELLGLPEGSQTSSALSVVGVGRRVYLLGGGVDPDEGAITTYSWALTAKPGGSAAAIFAIDQGASLLPDAIGQYTVELTVTDDQGETSEAVAEVITAGTWKGLSNCALCHGTNVEEWAETGHASILQLGLDGVASDHYGEGCISCHTVGYDVSETAVNGGFDDVAADLGWMFPEEFVSGTWSALPEELKNLGNVQCETCHGPGSEHMGNAATIDVSFDAGTCGQCHDSGTHHIFPYEWEQSAHATASPHTSGSCLPCHSGIGFAEYASEGVVTTEEHAPITCAACHDPHSVENEHQLRTLADVTLENGEVVTSGGFGKLCMNCHRSRRNVEEYVAEYHSHYGPHYGPQTDMLVGTNAVEYGEGIQSAGHSAADACVTCHMAATPGAEEPGAFSVGAHTFAMTWDADTPDDPSDDVENLAGCRSCHSDIETFDKPANADFDGDGSIEGAQTEIEGLMARLAVELPPIGEAEVEVTEDYTPEQLKAAYNYFFVEEDGSRGIHNTKYAVGILKLALRDMGVIVTSVELDQSAQATPVVYALAQNSPNPFNAETVIRYSVPEDGRVVLEVCNMLGQTIRTLVSGDQNAGSYLVRWDSRDDQGNSLSSGVYFYRLKTDTFSSTKRMVLLR